MELVDNFVWKPGIILVHMGMKDKGCIWGPDSYFGGHYKEEWFNDPFNVKVVEELDKSSMIVPGVFRSPYLGNINHLQISGGAKGVILLNTLPDVIVPMSAIGDNCYPLIKEVAMCKQVNLYYQGYIPLGLNDSFLFYDIDKKLLFNGTEARHWCIWEAPGEVELFFEPYHPGAGPYHPMEELNVY